MGSQRPPPRPASLELCWVLNGFLNDLNLWVLNRLLHEVYLWNLSLRHDRDVNGLVHELQRWNLDPLGLLVDFLLDDRLHSLHCKLDDFGLLLFDCVDDVLNAHVHTLSRLFFRLNDGYLNDLLSEWNSRGFQ